MKRDALDLAPAGPGAPLRPVLVAHLLYRLDTGGMEVLLAQCLARLPASRYRHVVLCLAGQGDFAARITAPGWAGQPAPVQVISLDKPPGLGLATHWRLWKLLRSLRPDILHTYNLPAVEYALTGAAAGVPVRIHAEHGRSMLDPQGLNPRHRLLRRLTANFIHAFVPVSRDLRRWLEQHIGVPPQRIHLIVNGVDTERFHPPLAGAQRTGRGDRFIIGTVGRIEAVKNHDGLLDAYVLLRQQLDEAQRRQVLLAIVGDGPLLPKLRQRVRDEGLQDAVWLAGERHDIDRLMRRFSIFVLPSHAEGTPVALLEAMASGLPVLASAVGGVPDLVQPRRNGVLLAPSDSAGWARAMLAYFHYPQWIKEHGAHGRMLAQQYGIAAMVQSYDALYQALCQGALRHGRRKQARVEATCVE